MVAHRIKPATGKQLNSSGNVDPILHHRSRLVIVLVESARAGNVRRAIDRLDRKRLIRFKDILAAHVVVYGTGRLLHAAQEAYPAMASDELKYLPARLGGSAPTLEQASALDAEEAARRGTPRGSAA